MSGEKLTINQWALDERPRERLMQHGAETLSNAELLAILIGSGNPQESAVDLMRRVLTDCNNNLATLGRMSIAQLCQYNGIGEAKAVTLMAAAELGKRRQLEAAAERPTCNSSAAIYNLMRPGMADLGIEEFWVLLLNNSFRLIGKQRIARGGLTEVTADIRIMLREALLAGASVMAVCHNHPSGSIRPSKQDDTLTSRIAQACNIMNIHFLDHVIVGSDAYYSYRDEGRI